MILVTGANGFIGSALIWQFNEVGLGPIIAVDSVSQADRPQTLANRKIEKFLLKDEIWDFLAENPKIDWVVHMGACSSTTETNEEFLRENNTEYTRKLFEYCRDKKIPYIYASSGAVYGDGSKGFSDEKAPSEYEPLNLYGESKASFDRWVVKQDQAPPNWYGLRFFNVYGPGETHKGDMASVVFKAFHQIKENGSLKLFRSHRDDYGDGKQERDFVYVKDICSWVLELIDKKPDSGIYNMGYGEPRTWLDLAANTFKNMDLEMNIDWIDMPENIRDQYQYTTCAEMKKWTSNGLNPPQWALERGIADYIQFLQSEKSYL